MVYVIIILLIGVVVCGILLEVVIRKEYKKRMDNDVLFVKYRGGKEK
jgi:hypothetical protein